MHRSQTRSAPVASFTHKALCTVARRKRSQFWDDYAIDLSVRDGLRVLCVRDDSSVLSVRDDSSIFSMRDRSSVLQCERSFERSWCERSSNRSL